MKYFQVFTLVAVIFEKHEKNDFNSINAVKLALIFEKHGIFVEARYSKRSKMLFEIISLV